MKKTVEIMTIENETSLEPIKERLTSLIGTKYEFTVLIARRALQLAHGHLSLFETEGYECEFELPLDPIDIAMMEFTKEPTKFPLAVKRILPDGRSEVLRINDLSWIDY